MYDNNRSERNHGVNRSAKPVCIYIYYIIDTIIFGRWSAVVAGWGEGERGKRQHPVRDRTPSSSPSRRQRRRWWRQRRRYRSDPGGDSPIETRPAAAATGSTAGSPRPRMSTINRISRSCTTHASASPGIIPRRPSTDQWELYPVVVK